MRSKSTKFVSLLVITVCLKFTESNAGTTTKVAEFATTPASADSGSKDKGVSNRVINIQDMKGKRTVSSVVVSGPANIGVPSFCFQRVDAGPCAMDIIRVYYDYKTLTCRSFSYSGCGGNANRFVSTKNCYYMCHPYYRIITAKDVKEETDTPSEGSTGAAGSATTSAAPTTKK